MPWDENDNYISLEESERKCVSLIKKHMEHLRDGLITFDEAKDRIFQEVYTGKHYLIP